MEEQQPHPIGDSYQMGDVGAGARVAQGHDITWTEGFGGDPQGDALKRQFEDLLARIDRAPDLDEYERVLAKEKTEAVANGLANAQHKPGRLRLALMDAKSFLSSSAHWVWDGLNQILTSDAAQKTIGTITEASTRAAIQSLTGLLRRGLHRALPARLATGVGTAEAGAGCLPLTRLPRSALSTRSRRNSLQGGPSG